MPSFAPVAGFPLAELISGVMIPESLRNAVVTSLHIDSRAVAPGGLFIAVPGYEADGRTYIAQALAAGAVAVLAEAEGLAEPGEKVIPVADLRRKVSDIAGRFYGNPSKTLRVTGITGTNGKTTCAHLYGQLMSLLDAKTAMIGTLGFGVFDKAKVEIEAFGLTTPDAISVQRLLAESLAEGATRAVMEVSSHSLNQDRVAGVAFDTAIFTNLSRDHLDYHSDMDAYLAAKQKLFLEHRAQRAMINIDDPAGVRLAESLAGDVEVVSYGLGEADVCARDVALTSGGIEARFATPWGEGHLRSELLGEFNLYNLLAVIAAACSQGCELKAVLAAVAELKPVSGRMELVTSSAAVAPHVVVDYAHTPDALAKALQSLRGHCNGDLWVVFGCGGDRDKGKRAEMGAVADAIADVVMITSDNPRSEKPLDIMLDIAAAVSEAHMVESRADAIKTSIAEADPGDTILIAGKGHEDYQVIGDQHLPFSDAETARSALEEIWGAGDE